MILQLLGTMLLGLLGFGTQTGRGAISYTISEANKLYYKLIRFIFILIGLIIVGWICNRFGGQWRAINTPFALIFALAAMIVWFKPINLVIVASTGAVVETFRSESKGSSAGAEKFLENFADILFNALAWGSFVLLTLRIIPLESHPWMFFWDVLVIVIFYKILCQAWDFPGKLAKKLIYRTTQLIITCCVLIMIPSSVYVKVIGFDLGSAMIISNHDNATASAEKSLRDQEMKERDEKIKKLQNKVDAGTATFEEKNELKKLIREGSLIGQMVSGASFLAEKSKVTFSGGNSTGEKGERNKESHSFTLYGIVSEETSLSPGTWKVSGDWNSAEYRLKEWGKEDFRPITEEIKISKQSNVYFRNKDKSGRSNVYSQIKISN
jgi:hypothetical protein